MKLSKIGRNERCPCGSGKKYKRCCLNRDPLADAASEDLQVIADLVESRDDVLGEELLFHLRDLLKPGGLLENLRYNDVRFTRAVAPSLPRLMEEFPDGPSTRDGGQNPAALDRWMELSIPLLTSRRFAVRAQAELMEVLADGELDAPYRQALLLAMPRMDAGPHDGPSFLDAALFPIQAREWLLDWLALQDALEQPPEPTDDASTAEPSSTRSLNEVFSGAPHMMLTVEGPLREMGLGHLIDGLPTE